MQPQSSSHLPKRGNIMKYKIVITEINKDEPVAGFIAAPDRVIFTQQLESLDVTAVARLINREKP